jgi:hypothetical protein
MSTFTKFASIALIAVLGSSLVACSEVPTQTAQVDQKKKSDSICTHEYDEQGNLLYVVCMSTHSPFEDLPIAHGAVVMAQYSNQKKVAMKSTYTGSVDNCGGDHLSIYEKGAYCKPSNKTEKVEVKDLDEKDLSIR